MREFVLRFISDTKSNLFLFCITLLFGIQNCCIPFFSDDIYWINTLHGNSFAENFATFINVQQNHWFTQNGRFTCHAALQLLVGNGEYAYDIFITIVFGLTIVVISLWVRSKNTLFIYCLSAVSLLYLSPDSTSNFYWAAGGCNYLFPTLLSCSYLCGVRYYSCKNYAIWQMPFIVLFSLLAGWSHEIFSMPISFAIFCLVVINLRRIPCRLWMIIIPYWIGTLLIVLSPGTLSRVAAYTGTEDATFIGTTLMTKIITSFKIFRYGRSFYLLLLLMFYLAYKKSLIKFVKKYILLFISFAGTLGIVVILGVGGRAVWGVEVFSLLIILQWFNGILNEIKSYNPFYLIGAFLSTLVILHQASLIMPYKESWNSYRNVLTQIKCPGFNGTAIMDDWHSKHWWIEPFVAHPYEMMMEDMWMRIPLNINVCRSDQYYLLKDKSLWDSNIAQNINGDFYIPYTEEVEEKIKEEAFSMQLKPVSYSQTGSWLYLSWHIIIQQLMPQRYPKTITTIHTNEISKISVEDKTFIRFEKPMRPIYREINEIILK